MESKSTTGAGHGRGGRLGPHAASPQRRRVLSGLLVTVLVMAVLATISSQPAVSSPGLTERVNVSSADAEANDAGEPSRPGVSADGRLVAFSSRATNLVPDDTNGCTTSSCVTGPTGPPNG